MDQTIDNCVYYFPNTISKNLQKRPSEILMLQIIKDNNNSNNNDTHKILMLNYCVFVCF